MQNTIRRAAGSLLVVGLGGTELTGLERAWLRLVRPGGVILFRRNIIDAAQTRALVDESTGLGAPHGVRCVDVEGGTVNRLRDALAPMPSAQAVAQADRVAAPKRPFARVHGELIARAVKAFGFNTTLAPVVDLILPESVEVMGARAPAANPLEAARFARNFLLGLGAQDVAGCGKHFPGLGGAAGDTHFVTPAIARTWQQLWTEDLVPYRDLHAAIPMIMTNHAAYPASRGAGEPASASRYWITTVLRRQIGYRGIILSDDLEMGGILKFLPVEEAAVAAIRAGSDLLEICHSAELILRTYESLITAAEKSSAFRTLLLERARDCERKRARIYPPRKARPLTAAQFEKLRGEITQFRDKITAVTQAQDAEARATSPAERT
ncbi:MAG TPA: beta-N-acetylhexosaminidase [Terracidiphilus sp.]|nr:beta-N-acetylhexosaminidase [Terracidiphilus sp.]